MLQSQNKSHSILKAADGPYLFYNTDGSICIQGSDVDGTPIDKIYPELPKDFSLPIVSHSGKHRFNVKLHPIVRDDWKLASPEKLLVISDLHGDMDFYLKVLKGNGVINENYEWIYGKNALMIVGDICDRGDDVLPVFWLTYKLQQEAREAGGALYFIIGNHESRILSNDTGFMADKYFSFAQHFDREYAEFFGANTELGRWVAARNTIQIIGTDLYVHGGLSENFYNGNFEIPYVNQQISSGIFLYAEERDVMSAHSEFLFSRSTQRIGGSGPIWYRGMICPKGGVPELDEDIVDALLERYQVQRIIIGHTILPEVSFFYNGKVVAININHEDNIQRPGSRGILIEEGIRTYVVNDEGIV